MMSFNVWYENNDMKAVSRIVNSEAPDVLLVQELRDKSYLYLNQEMKISGLLFVSYDEDKKLAIFSRFPLVTLPSPGTQHTKIQKVRIKSEGGDFFVCNVHFVRGQEQRRKEEVNEFIRSDLVETTIPVILAGDLNTTKQTTIYRAINKRLHNSHDEVGRGFGFTFPSAPLQIFFKIKIPAMVRIDHIFYSSHFTAISSKTHQYSGGSDHYPVSAELSLYAPASKAVLSPDLSGIF